jgi:cyd operon protein YbgT
MWYFTWILGLLLACSLGIINVLRLEAQEAWDREHIALDPLTHLMTKDTMIGRLKEKVENSKRNGFPFSILLISLSDFTSKNKVATYEMDAILRGIVDCFNDDIRVGVDIAARLYDKEFLIAMPGSSLNKAEDIASRIKNSISERVKAPQGLVVEVSTGVAEFSVTSPALASTELEVDKLIRVAFEKSSV